MRKLLACVVVAILAPTSLTLAQNVPAQPNRERKITNRIAPTYPELAKRMHMRGIVRLEAMVRANGSVKSTKVLGGSPVLALAAGDAVSKWKFEPAPNETTEAIQIMFQPDNESQ
jgi:TonB family protein